MLRLTSVLVCLLVAGFCLFGFLATFELGVRHAMIFRFAYGVVSIGCVAAVVAIAASAARGYK